MRGQFKKQKTKTEDIEPQVEWCNIAAVVIDRQALALREIDQRLNSKNRIRICKKQTNRVDNNKNNKYRFDER